MKDIPAFPASLAADAEGHVYTSDDWQDSSGMTLRDYFAGQIIMGICGNFTVPTFDEKAERLVRAAYKTADAMMRERAKKIPADGE